PKYFGDGQGMTFYTWTSDQFSQYGTKVISTTVRDATDVLDEILDNETDLAILEHTTEFIPLSFWYDAPLTSRDSDRRHDSWLVYGSPICSLAPQSSWISPA